METKHKFQAGKYEGISMEIVALADPQYILWVFINVPHYKVPVPIANLALQCMKSQNKNPYFYEDDEEDPLEHLGDGYDEWK